MQFHTSHDPQTSALHAVGTRMAIREMKYEFYTPAVSRLTDLSRSLAKVYCSYAYILYLMMAIKPEVTSFSLPFAAKFALHPPRFHNSY